MCSFKLYTFFFFLLLSQINFKLVNLARHQTKTNNSNIFFNFNNNNNSLSLYGIKLN